MPDQATKRRVTQRHLDELAKADARKLVSGLGPDLSGPQPDRDPHGLPAGPAWLIRLRNASGSVEMSDFAAKQIADYVDALRVAAWPIVRALEDVGDETNWGLGEETDRVYPWYEIEPLKRAVLGLVLPQVLKAKASGR